MSRLARYRELLARIEPTGPKGYGGLPGIHVPPPSGLAEKLATALALRPTSSHLVVGVIGSGKTTTAHRAISELVSQVRETGDRVEYIDVSREHQLDAEPLSGVLIALAGRSLSARVPPLQEFAGNRELLSAQLAVRRHAIGVTEWVHEPDEPDWGGDDGPEDDPRVPVHFPGRLRPPATSLSRYGSFVQPLRVLRELGADSRACIFIFDSLDRLESSARFREAVEHDVPVLAQAGIGSVVVGPMRFGLSADRSVAELFDEIHVVQTANAESADGLTFLAAVLRSRASIDILPDDSLVRIARASGGVLRDLLSIATRAAMDAYDRGHDTVDVSDVESAVQAIGAAKAVGLDSASLNALMRVAAGEPFALDEKRLSMVERGQVVQTHVGAWRVHPSLQFFLESASKAA